MQYSLQQNETGTSSRHLIIYFCGWGMTPASVSHLTLPRGSDLLSLFGYHTLERGLSVELVPYSKYQDVSIVAWSLGVWAAEQVIPHCSELPPVRHLIAVAGSPYPMHNKWGIPKELFRGTLENLTESNRQRFNRRMCGSRRYKQLYDIFSERSTDELKGELQSVYDHITSEGQVDTVPHSRLTWSHAIIGGLDQIFPARNLLTVWGALGIPTTILPNGYHYLFDQWRSWDELLDLPQATV